MQDNYQVSPVGIPSKYLAQLFALSVCQKNGRLARERPIRAAASKEGLGRGNKQLKQTVMALQRVPQQWSKPLSRAFMTVTEILHVRLYQFQSNLILQSYINPIIQSCHYPEKVAMFYFRVQRQEMWLCCQETTARFIPRSRRRRGRQWRRIGRKEGREARMKG